MTGRFNNKSTAFFPTQCTDVYRTIFTVNVFTSVHSVHRQDVLAGVYRVLCEVQTESLHTVQSTVNMVTVNIIRATT